MDTLQSLHLSSPLVWASSVESPAPVPSGHSPVHTQHSVVSSPGEEWMEVLWSQCPYIPALSSTLRCETVPGHEKTASFHPRGSCDRWWLAVSSMWLRTSVTTKEYGCSEIKAGRENPLVLPHLFFSEGCLSWGLLPFLLGTILPPSLPLALPNTTFFFPNVINDYIQSGLKQVFKILLHVLFHLHNSDTIYIYIK